MHKKRNISSVSFSNRDETIKVWWFDNCQEKFWLCFVWMTTFLRRLNNKWHKQVSQSLSFTYGKLNSLKFPRAEPSEEKHCGKIFCIWNIFHFIFCEKKKYLHVWNNYFFLYNIFFNALIFFFNKLTKQKIPPVSPQI